MIVNAFMFPALGTKNAPEDSGAFFVLLLSLRKLNSEDRISNLLTQPHYLYRLRPPFDIYLTQALNFQNAHINMFKHLSGY